MHGFTGRFRLSMVSLWQARNEMHLKDIRKSHLHYLLALPLVFALADTKGSFFNLDNLLFGLDISALTYLAYCIGFSLVFFTKESNIRHFSGISALITLIALISSFLLPSEEARMLSAVVCWLGQGGCAAGSVYAFIFALRNAERLMGIIIIAFSYGFFVCLRNITRVSPFTDKILLSFLIISFTICIFLFRQKDFPDTSKKAAATIPRSAYIFLVYSFAYFTINIFGETVLYSAGQYELKFYGLGGMSAIVVSLLIQLVFRRSVWHMWNTFFILCLLGISLMLTTRPSSSFTFGVILFGIGNGVGYIAVLYMGLGIIKKYNSYLYFKKATVLLVIIMIFPAIGAGLLSSSYPHALQPATAVVSGLMFIIITLFSPVFYRTIFAADQIDDFNRFDMSVAGDRFSGFSLSPREKEVCLLLLEGFTMRQIAGKLGIADTTVNGYLSSLYRKLQINSRTELLVKFGVLNKG